MKLYILCGKLYDKFIYRDVKCLYLNFYYMYFYILKEIDYFYSENRKMYVYNFKIKVLKINNIHIELFYNVYN